MITNEERIRAILAEERQAGVEQGVKECVLSLDRIKSWSTMEPFCLEQFQHWVDLEIKKVEAKYPFLTPHKDELTPDKESNG